MTTKLEKKATFRTEFRSSSLGESAEDDYFPDQDVCSSGMDSDSTPPQFSVGVLADIQYAPIPDGASYTGVKRYYRHALQVARSASDHFQQEKVDLVLNLGDIVDGKCQEIVKYGGDPIPEDVDPGLLSLDHVMEALSIYKEGPTMHVYGNHCLYNMDRSMIGKRLGIPFTQEPSGDLVGYYHQVHHGIRFVVIDGYDIAMMGRCENISQKRREAEQILSENNPNYATNINGPEGLVGLERRFVGFNGAVGKPQLSWLRECLGQAREANEKVIVLSHQPIHPDSTNPVCLIWNYDEVLQVIREHADVVLASFSGHAHKGGYVRDKKSGVHFRVFEAVLESHPEHTYAIVDVFQDHLVVRGFGDCRSASYNFDHTETAKPKM